MKRHQPTANFAILTIATLTLGGISAFAQVATVPGTGLSFIPPKGFTANEKLAKAIRGNAGGNSSGLPEMKYIYQLVRPQYPTAIMVMVQPCPDEALPDSAAAKIRDGYLSTDPSLKLMSEGWAQIGGERAYVVTASGAFETKQGGAPPIPITRCFTAVPHKGTLTTFLFTARADTFAKDLTAYSQVLKSVRFK